MFGPNSEMKIEPVQGWAVLVGDNGPWEEEAAYRPNGYPSMKGGLMRN
jgi:hypothetical protein